MEVRIKISFRAAKEWKLSGLPQVTCLTYGEQQ
jgi:hypothetical protein